METKGKLAEALAKAQSQMGEAVLDSVNPHYRSKFASLRSCWVAAKHALSANGLSIVQSVGHNEGEYVLITHLLHVSGEEVTSEIPLILGKKDMQGLGSAITYARRYGLGAMIGLVTDADDDGNATKNEEAPPEKPTTKFQNYPWAWKVKDRELGDIQLTELHTMADKAKNIEKPSKAQEATLKAVKAAIKRLEDGEIPA